MSIETWITTEPIDTGRVLSATGSPADGAILLFLGIVRRENGGREVTGMRYDAYGSMAERVLREIAGEAANTYGATHVAAVHRTGDLAIGDVSVAVAVSTPHRADAFTAGRWVIDELKRRLPVWKKEHYVDGSRWLDGSSPPVPETSP
jgi:molybdopterin synthase catalytic subunit